ARVERLALRAREGRRGALHELLVLRRAHVAGGAAVRLAEDGGDLERTVGPHAVVLRVLAAGDAAALGDLGAGLPRVLVLDRAARRAGVEVVPEGGAPVLVLAARAVVGVVEGGEPLLVGAAREDDRHLLRRALVLRPRHLDLGVVAHAQEVARGLARHLGG